jgi:hypothetical protein
LFLFAQAINKVSDIFDYQKINLGNYFSNKEITQWENYTESDNINTNDDIIIEDINQISDHHWEGVITSKTLFELESQHRFIYNPNTQRNPKITKRGIKLNINPNKVLEIKKLILQGDYEPDNLRFNIVYDVSPPPQYNKKYRTLTISSSSVINIVDGKHRLDANTAAVLENSNLDMRWAVTFYYVTEMKAHDIMVQINKQTPMKSEWIQGKDHSKVENRVITYMADQNSELFKIMKDDDKHIEFKQALVKKFNISQAISENYKDVLQDNESIRQVSNWMSIFFDYLLKLYSYEFLENPQEVKQVSFINWKNIFYGYVALSRELMNLSDTIWKDKLKQKMLSIDFSLGNQELINMGLLNTRDANKKTRERIYQYFREGV